MSYFIKTLRVKFDAVGKYGEPDGTVGYYVEYAHEIINFFDKNDKILRNILESELSGNIINVIVSENLKETKNRLRASCEMGLALPASVDTVSAMLVGGVANVVSNWFKNGKPISKDILLDEITAIIKIGENKS